MTEKKGKKKECCIHLCVNCKNYKIEHIGNPGKTTFNRCSIAIDQVNDCVTGGKSNIYLIPEEANKCGNCKYYDEDIQKILWNELHALAQRYYYEVFMDYPGDYTGWSEYHAIDNLLNVLNEPREWVSDEDDSDYATPDYRDDSNSEEPKKKKKHWWQ